MHNADGRAGVDPLAMKRAGHGAGRVRNVGGHRGGVSRVENDVVLLAGLTRRVVVMVVMGNEGHGVGAGWYVRREGASSIGDAVVQEASFGEAETVRPTVIGGDGWHGGDR